MITKERLEELIEQGATIYTSRFKKPEKYKLYKDYFIDKDKLCACNKSHTAIECVIKLDKLFEIEEDARWEIEMIGTRTETLKLPKYADFKNGQTIHFNCYPCDYECSTDLVNIYIREFFGFGGKDLYTKPLTKENYIEACKLCLRLFNGE